MADKNNIKTHKRALKLLSSERNQRFLVQKYDFLMYYQGQAILDDAEEEWENFWETLFQPLPVTFRVNVSTAAKDRILDQLKYYNDEKNGEGHLLAKHNVLLRNVLLDFFTRKLPSHKAHNQRHSPLPWYEPHGAAWHLDCGLQEFKKLSKANEDVQKFHRFLHDETEDGHISRQEAVSMIPAFLLDLQAGDWVLDMCSAPGSKSCQMLERLSCAREGRTGEEEKLPLLVANELDYRRATLLSHQLQRLDVPYVAVTCGDASEFPGLFVVSADGNRKLSDREVFDKILCDVPCSGDGTSRKNPDMFKNWHVNAGTSLHTTQLAIAEKGLQLLKVGGTLVYSTCSYNPVENEAVVAELLRRHGDALTLLDVSSELPSLIRREGMSSWRVAQLPRSRKKVQQRIKKIHKELIKQVEEHHTTEEISPVLEEEAMQWFSNWEEVPKDLQERLPRSAFPSDSSEAGNITEKLHRCLRLRPHDSNSGGFFVAVFRKEKATAASFSRAAAQEDVSEGEREEEEERLEGQGGSQEEGEDQPRKKAKVEGDDEKMTVSESIGETHDTNTARRRRNMELNSNFQKYTSLSGEDWSAIQEMYGLPDSYHKLLYYSNNKAAIHEIPTHVASACIIDESPLKLVHLGGRRFDRNKGGFANAITYRVSTLGVSALAKAITKRKLMMASLDLLFIAKRAMEDSVVRFNYMNIDVVAAFRKFGDGPLLLIAADMNSDGLACGLTCFKGSEMISVLMTKDSIRQTMREIEYLVQR